MTGITLNDIQMGFALVLFVFGGISLTAGIFILVVRSTGKEIRTLANQTTQLAKKGVAEDVAGLVGNASSLLSATNELIRTTAGIGVFLSVMGFLLMAVAAWLALSMQRTDISSLINPSLLRWW
jgi:hypothetical protein